jgi:hypothetical protein
MAITQISKIQVRRGLQQDLGQLAAGEIAWAIDTQRLYIGNGSTAEGAPVAGTTEIVTNSQLASQPLDLIAGAYHYEGILGGIGVADTNTTERRYQDKFDDIINVRDFGARGTGTGDDLAALQRCINETYNRNRGGITPYPTRRAIKISGGIYNISDSLKIPPHATLIGDGSSSVIIRQTSGAASSVLKTMTNLGLDPTNGDNIDFEYPKNINIIGITFQSITPIDIAHLESVSNCLFQDVNFIGPIIEPDGTEIRNICVNVSSEASMSTSIIFRDCSFNGLSYGARITNGSDGVVFDDCEFKNLYQGVNVMSGTTPPKNIKITNSRFDTIHGSAIVGGVGASGIVSSNNVYVDVGNNYVSEAPGVAVTPIIVFQADNNYSIADTFSRSVADSSSTPRISSGGYAIVSASIDDAFRLGTAYQTAGRKISLINNTSTTIAIPNITHGIIDYSIIRDALFRSGMIKFVTSDTGVIRFDEEYTENSDLGITIRMGSGSGSSSLIVILSSLGYDATIAFDVKTLH